MKQEIIEAILEGLENTPEYVDMVKQRYEPGRYEREVGDCVNILSIQKISEVKCRFVFDTRKTSCWAKIAGELYIDQDVKASYKANR